MLVNFLVLPRACLGRNPYLKKCNHSVFYNPARFLFFIRVSSMNDTWHAFGIVVEGLSNLGLSFLLL